MTSWEPTGQPLDVNEDAPLGVDEPLPDAEVEAFLDGTDVTKAAGEPVHYKGPGHWRRQAEQAQRDDPDYLAGPQTPEE